MILPIKCPHCSFNLEGDEIKTGERALLGSDQTRWSKVQLIVEKGVAVSFRCPECEKEWPVPWMPTTPAKDVE
jgi:predicted Zn-ribbon and HTH transcriptional regulator